MKLSRHAFVRFWDVHAWIGVVGGVVLHVMFFAGAFALFRAELTDWQEGPAAPTAAGAARAGVGATIDRALLDRSAHPAVVDIWLPNGGGRFAEIGWQDGGPTAERIELRLDTASGAAAPATSHLATILYWLHFLYHPKAAWGMYVAGAFGVALLLALVTGLLIHIKNLTSQFHQFRPAKGTRVLWSDMHKVLGVMGLPFQVMYALTGALLCFVSVALALFVGPVFNGDRQAARASLWAEPKIAAVEPRGERLGLDGLLGRARAAVPGFRPEFIRIEGVDAGATTVSLWGSLSGRLFRRGDVVLRARDGALMAETVSAYPTPGAAATRWLTGLHYAWFGGLAAKVLYALLAAASCLTILSGNWIWLARRQARAQSKGNRALAKLTIGVGGGVVLATAALFWANRMAPPSVRMVAEMGAFFGAWAVCTVLFVLRADARGGWVGLLRLSGAAFALLPIAGIVRHGSAPVGSSASSLPGVEIGLLLVGATLWSIAAIVKRRTAGSAPALAAPAGLAPPEASEGNA